MELENFATFSKHTTPFPKKNGWQYWLHNTSPHKPLLYIRWCMLNPINPPTQQPKWLQYFNCNLDIWLVAYTSPRSSHPVLNIPVLHLLPGPLHQRVLPIFLLLPLLLRAQKVVPLPEPGRHLLFPGEAHVGAGVGRLGPTTLFRYGRVADLVPLSILVPPHCTLHQRTFRRFEGSRSAWSRLGSFARVVLAEMGESYRVGEVDEETYTHPATEPHPGLVGEVHHEHCV